MYSAALALLFLVVSFTAAAGEHDSGAVPQCGKFEVLREVIYRQWKESPTHLGTLKLWIPSQRRFVDVFVVLFTNKKTGDFTMVRVYPKDIPSPFAGKTCIMVSGRNWGYNAVPEVELGEKL